MNNFLKYLQTREPVAVATAVRLVLYAAVLLNWSHLTGAQIVGIGAAVEGVLGVFTRQSVVPKATHNDVVNTALRMPTSATVEDLKARLAEKKQLEATNK